MRKFLRKAVEFCIGPINHTSNIRGNDLMEVAMSPSNELNDTYLFDFKNWNGGGSGGNNPMAVGTVTMGWDGDTESKFVKNKKVKVKPIDVLKELETTPTPFSLKLLDEKIQLLKDKEKIIQQHYAKREMTYLIERLENRKKYAETQDFFDKFQNTTEEKISVLLEKYELVMRSSDIFVPEFPKEAIDVMQAYIEKVKQVCNKAPIFYVIATSDSFQQNYGKRDPILLVQSPFGFYYQILGAWDEEMLILSEL